MAADRDIDYSFCACLPRYKHGGDEGRVVVLHSHLDKIGVFSILGSPLMHCNSNRLCLLPKKKRTTTFLLLVAQSQNPPTDSSFLLLAAVPNKSCPTTSTISARSNFKAELPFTEELLILLPLCISVCKVLGKITNAATQNHNT